MNIQKEEVKTINEEYVNDELNHAIKVFTITLKKHINSNTFLDIVTKCAQIEQTNNKFEVILYLIDATNNHLKQKEEDTHLLKQKFKLAKENANRETSFRIDEEDSNIELKREVEHLKKLINKFKNKEFRNNSLLLEIDELKEQSQSVKEENSLLTFKLSNLQQKYEKTQSQIKTNEINNVVMQSIILNLNRIQINFKKRNSEKRITESFIQGRIEYNKNLWEQYKELQNDSTQTTYKEVFKQFEENQNFLLEKLNKQNFVNISKDNKNNKMDPINKDLCKLVMNNIPVYDSEENSTKPELLENFLMLAEYLSHSIETTKMKEYIMLISNFKLRGTIHNWFLGKRYTKFDDFSKEVKERFAEQISVEDLLVEIQNIRQRANETVEDFGRRTLQLVDKINEGYKTRYGNDDKYPIVTDLTLLSFEKGLIDERVKLHLASTVPKTLDEAITTSISFSKMTNRLTSRNEINRLVNLQTLSNCQLCDENDHEADKCPGQDKKPQLCQYCRKHGHNAKQCNKRKNDTDTQKQDTIKCQLCGNYNHEALDCALNKTSVQGNTNKKNNNQHQSIKSNNRGQSTYNDNYNSGQPSSNNNYNNRLPMNNNYNRGQYMNDNSNNRQPINNNYSSGQYPNNYYNNRQSMNNNYSQGNHQQSNNNYSQGNNYQSNNNQRNNQQSNNNNQNQQQPMHQSNNTNLAKISCVVCGKMDHLMANCSDFKNLMLSMSGNEN